ncbi:MAG: SusD/RagB family nutrient-binding outer membrane lipoprotein [Bacteroidota bacterium]
MKKTNIIFTGIILFMLSACTKNFEEINTNPNNPPTSDPNYIFNYVTKEAAGEYGYLGTYNLWHMQRWVMQTSMVYGNSTMPPYSLFENGRITNLWDFFYSDLLLNCHVLVQETAEDPDAANKHSIAQIWKVYSFHKVTDLWGAVPYFNAWKLLEEYTDENLYPIYDSQEDIYLDMLSVLKEAAEGIDPSGVMYETDMIFDGDPKMWVKFANSLRLRLAVRSGNEAVVSEIIAEDNLIAATEEGAIFKYIDSENWWNPFYELNISSKNPSLPEYTGAGVPRISKLMTDQLQRTRDPRLAVYAQPIEQDDVTYRGVPNLMNSSKKENQALKMSVFNTSYIGRYFTENKELEKQLLSYAEVCFLRSEAAFNGWTSENPQSWYEEGVRSSMEYYNIDPVEIDTFLLERGAYADSLGQIMTQKWLAMFLDGYEAFADYRRTGHPQLMKYDLVLDGNNKIVDSTWVEVPRSYLPGRLPYPDIEKELNEESYMNAVEQIGEDDYYQQVWWSKKFGEIDY